VTNLPLTTNISTGCGHHYIEYIMTCLQNFEQKGGTCFELQCYTLLSYIFSTSAEKKPLLHLPIAVSDVTDTFVVVQANNISVCEYTE